MNKKILVPLFLIFLVGSVMAVSWPFPKAKSCESFNVTGIDCDRFWCESIQEGNYSVEKELCIFVINNTIVSNMTSNETSNATINETNFYNKSDIDKMISDVKINFTQKYALQDDFDDLKDEVYEIKPAKEGITSTELTIGFLILIVVAGVFYFMNQNKQQKTPLQLGLAQLEVPKIQTTKEKEKEYDVKEVLKKIGDLEKQKSKKTKPKKKKEEEEELEEEDIDEEEVED